MQSNLQEFPTFKYQLAKKKNIFSIFHNYYNNDGQIYNCNKKISKTFLANTLYRTCIKIGDVA